MILRILNIFKHFLYDCMIVTSVSLLGRRKKYTHGLEELCAQKT